MKQYMIGPESLLFNQQTGDYTLWLGNRAGMTFSSKRFAYAFAADTNRWLNSILIELNQLYVAVFTEYRHAWFTLYNIKNGKRVNEADTERRIEKALADVADQFTRAGNSFRGSSSAAWSFRHLENICMYLGDAAGLLITVNKRRNNTVNYHNLTIHKRNIDAVADRIINYPDTLPDGCKGVHRN